MPLSSKGVTEFFLQLVCKKNRHAGVPLLGECRDATRGLPSAASKGKQQVDKAPHQGAAVHADCFSGHECVVPYTAQVTDNHSDGLCQTD